METLLSTNPLFLSNFFMTPLFVQISKTRNPPPNFRGGRKLCVVLILLGQQCTAENTMQYCLRGFKKNCVGKNPVQCFLNTLGATLNRSNLYAMLSKRLLTTLHKKKSRPLLPSYSWENIAELKTHCNVVREAPDNFA